MTEDEYVAASIERMAAALHDGDRAAVNAVIDQAEFDGHPELAATLRGQIHEQGVDALIASGGAR